MRTWEPLQQAAGRRYFVVRHPCTNPTPPFSSQLQPPPIYVPLQVNRHPVTSKGAILGPSYGVLHYGLASPEVPSGTVAHADLVDTDLAIASRGPRVSARSVPWRCGPSAVGAGPGASKWGRGRVTDFQGSDAENLERLPFFKRAIAPPAEASEIGGS